ncbi:MAG: pilus assembly protein PilM [Candidatus Omnitrophica bacterium]|nr:pilus assembly protein PilM [Candidatus Omnitrophota bacterium]
MAKKQAGLNKKVSSIFSGIPNLDEQTPQSAQRAQTPPDFFKQTRTAGMSQVENLISGFGAFQKRPKLMFEIGASKMKALFLTFEAGDWQVDGASEYEFPANERGERIREENGMIECIRSLAEQLDPSHKAQVGLVISGSNTFSSTIPPPANPKKEWRDAIIWQLAETSLFPLEEAEILWTPMTQAEPETLGEKRLCVSAVSIEELDKIQKLFEQAGLNLEVVTPSPPAVEWLMHMYRRPLPETTLIMDIGAENTRFYWLHHGRFVYMRQTGMGCDHVNRGLMGTIQVDQERFQIGFDEALKLIKEYRLLSTAQSMDPAHPRRSQLAARLRPVMDKLVGEIRRSLSYFDSEFQTGGVKEIFLLGSGSNLEGLAGFLSAELGLPVHKLDLTTDFNFRISANTLENAPSFKQAFGPVAGLGLAKRHPINFSDWRARCKPLAIQAKQITKLASVAVLALSLLNVTWLSFKQFGLERQLDAVKKQLEMAGPQTMQLEELGILTNAIQEMKAKLDRAIQTQPPWTGVLQELSQLVPRDMLLERLDVADEKNIKYITLYGFIRNASAVGDLIVSDLLKSLNESPFFTSASLLSRSQQELEENTRSIFSVKAQLL